ncbi:MAG: 2-oxoacid:acceptor oxidoreductase family protein [Bacteroidales bacterium]|nr:2-oxoacid:acceptor oxidoreductase family protein [Bacteroidales bacterium]
MNEEIIIAGFGGQGVLLMGKIMAYAAMMQNLEVSWMPSYGPEMRGGTANVTVVISSERISSPIVNSYDTAILLNQQSLDKFENSVKTEGILLYDPNGISRHPERKDIRIFQVSAASEAAKMLTTKTFNMIVLGAYLKINSLISLENVIKGIGDSLPERHHHLIPVNIEAVKRGMEIVKKINS